MHCVSLRSFRLCIVFHISETHTENDRRREYGPGGAYEFWSLGKPKVEIAKLCPELEAVVNVTLAWISASGWAVGPYFGLRPGARRPSLRSSARSTAEQVAYLARAKSAETTVVAGVDFAWAAIQAARREYNGTAGASDRGL